MNYTAVKVHKNHMIKRSESVETNDIKNLLLNGTDPIEENPYVMPSVKPTSDMTNMIVYSRSLNEDEVVIKDEAEPQRKSSFDVTSENQDNVMNDNASR